MSDPHDEAEGGIPRWVKVSVTVGAVVLLVAMAVMLLGGGHVPRSHRGIFATPSAEVPGGHTPPAGSHR